MKISLNWLKTYIKTDLPAEEIARILTGIGLEVEALEKIESIRGGLAGLVVGEVLTCEKHPDADKLHVTTVDLGDGVVSGEYNIAYANNFVGHSTSLVNTDDCYNVFAAAGMTVERNGELFDTGAAVSGGTFGLNYNSVEERADTDTVEFYTS